MSHVSIGEARIQQTDLDLQAIKLACEHLGLVFCEGVTTYKWYGTWVGDYHGDDAAYRKIDPKKFGQCKHMIHLPWSAQEEADPTRRPYEIGLVEMEDGTLAPVFDHYGSGRRLMSLLGGKTCGKLMQLIDQYKVTLKAAQQKGHYVKSVERLAGGKVQIRIGVKQPDRL